MAIKSNDKIIADDIISLKTKLVTLFSNRTLTIKDNLENGTSITQQLSGTPKTNIDNVSIKSNEKIEQDDLMFLLNNCLIINDIPNLTIQSQYTNILKDGVTNNILSWLSDTLCNAKDDSTAHGCRGACVGICHGACSHTATGASAEYHGIDSYNNNAGSSCSGCSTTCTTTCGNSCTSCSSLCSGSATEQTKCNGCHGTCTLGCAGSCSGTCSGSSCKGTCKSGCGGCNSGCTSCAGCGGSCGSACKVGCQGCDSHCQGTCKNGCAWNCKNGCYGSDTGGTYT